jgi:hypothetical protein
MTALTADTVLDPEKFYILCAIAGNYRTWSRPQRAGGCGDMNHKRDTAGEVALFIAEYLGEPSTFDSLELYEMPTVPAFIMPIRDAAGKLLIHRA